MTNHWADIGNASLVLAIGCNPAENHPACMAHVNSARFDIHYDDAGNPLSYNLQDDLTTRSGAGRKARLIVVDPRRTRTAQQTENTPGDLYVRIRPGTDIAFMNGLMNYIFADFESATPYNATAATNFFNWHNGLTANSTNLTTTAASARTFYDDSGAAIAMVTGEWTGALYEDYPIGGGTYTAPGLSATRGWPKYTDARVKLRAAASETDDKVTFADTVPSSPAWMNLKHAAVTNTPLVHSGLLGTGTEFVEGVDFNFDRVGGRIQRIDGFGIGATDIVYVTYAAKVDDYQRVRMTSGTGKVFSNMLHMLNDIRDAGSVYNKLKDHVAPYTLAVAADICGCSQNDLINVARAMIDNSRLADSRYAASMVGGQINVECASYRATTLLYAMGATQHTKGSQNIRSYAILQSMLGNMGRPGGGINALRGIHNVQGSTDMGVLFDLIPAYSGNPGTTVSYAAYSNALFGNRVVVGTDPGDPTAVIKTNRSAYSPGDLGLQQRGFYNMTREWFGDTTTPVGVAVADETIVLNGTTATALANKPLLTTPAVVVRSAPAGGGTLYALGTHYTINALLGTIVRTAASTIPDGGTVYVSYSYDVVMDKLYSLWPKGNGYDHITAFRNMLPGAAAPITGAVVWGQNPAVTEPNQSVVRDALKNLETLVCVDMFPNETAECDRKGTGETYLIPACSHVEEAGSVSNSGRWIQWRQRATVPKGNSKADLELLLRFAKALDEAGAFSHIKTVWATMPTGSTLKAAGDAAGASVWPVLYGKYGSPIAGGAGWDGTSSFDLLTGVDVDSISLTGSEFVADRVFWEMARPLNLNNGTTNDGGTIWIYSGNDAASGYSTFANKTNVQPTLSPALSWTVANRAKSRDNSFQGNARNYPRWGWAWLLNRRVQYNNGEVPNEVSDNFVAAGLMARMFVTNANTLAEWSNVYRAYNTLADVPNQELAVGGPHVAGGRFPAHTEPYETPRDGNDGKANLVARFGYNTARGASLIKSTLSPRGTYNADPALGYPLILTTIRCVEHFQGGPITRNNSWNVEAEPVPWIEINSLDARKYGISDGDWVNVITARSNSTSDQEAHTPGYTVAEGTGWAEGFKARVGSGLSSAQRVAPGVVAIPWHWGDKGLAKGSRANDLTIDSWDANTFIPEYKACLCKIEPIHP